MVRRARQYFAEGDFRWVAQVVHHVLFAEPDHAEARALQADALKQLGDTLAIRVGGRAARRGHGAGRMVPPHPRRAVRPEVAQRRPHSPPGHAAGDAGGGDPRRRPWSRGTMSA
ncbi:alkyl sulfatase dimerization domain-containing protein [Streptomyces albidoflavus]|uniref:alkyl sulfatase dimerization domain-containing protein n=1 Tax=Streptomyces albidoflavus TaxID=1886 RepID=UPI0033A317B2